MQYGCLEWFMALTVSGVVASSVNGQISAGSTDNLSFTGQQPSGPISGLPIEPARLLQIHEGNQHAAVGANPVNVFRFGEHAAVVVDIDNTLTLVIDSAQATSAGVTKLTITSAEVHGPLRINPTPEIPIPKVDLTWTNGVLSGTGIQIVPQSARIEPDDAIGVKLTISVEGLNPSPLSRTTSMLLRFQRFGLTHHESDSFVFVRSAQTEAWDSRPGATATFGWAARGDRHPKVTGLWNFLSPRLGVNVTLLDFDQNQTIEFGVGPTVTFIRGGIIAGVGWNLSTDFQKREYFYLGISFANIANIISEALNDDRGN